MLYLEAIEDRLLLSSVLSVAPGDIGNLSAPPSTVGSTTVPIATPAARSTRHVTLVSFTLFDPRTGEALGQLTEGETIDLASLPKKGLGIRADSQAPTVGSVIFGYDGNSDYHVENYVPYTLIGSGDGSYESWTPTVGEHTVTATAYSSSWGTGTAGSPISVDFNVINTAAITNFTLVDADNNQSLGPLVNGQTINLATLPTQNLTVIATPNPAVVGSVVFDYDGDTRYHLENFTPYALVGKTWDGFFAWTPSVGSHTLTATPYPGIRGHGSSGTPLTIEFNVINTSAPSVTGLSLIDDDNGQTLGSLVEGQTIDLATLPTQNISIAATADSTAGSVVFGYDGNSTYQVEDSSPYELTSWTPAVGGHTITATAYSDADGGGIAGAPLSVDFTIIDSTPVVPPVALTVTGFTLVDADNGQTLGPLVEGETIDLGNLPTQNLEVVATTSAGSGSIVFGYDTNADYQTVDAAPYELNSFTPAIGSHTITATPYSAADGGGTAGTTDGVDFTVVNSSIPTPPVIPPVPAITGFNVIDTDNGQFLGSLSEGQTLDLGTLPTQDISLVAVPSALGAGSVDFGYDGTADVQSVDESPYTFSSWTPALGAHTITATAYSGADDAGSAGTPLSVDFTIVDSTAVSGFVLVDTDNGQALESLNEGQTIDLAAMPTRDLAIAATTTDTVVGSVLFGYDGNANYFVQNGPSSPSDSWTPTVGNHTITATPYSAANATGLAGTPLSVDFTVINSAATTSFTLVDTDNGQSLGALSQNETLDLATLPTLDLSIEANTTPTTIGSVVFGYDGTDNVDLENTAPYILASWTPAVGSHTITATPYSAAGGGGFAGAPLSVNFTIVNSEAITGFTLVDSDNGQSLGSLTEGQTIDLHTLPTRDLTVLASTSSAPVGSVVFGYDGNASYQLDNAAPYALAGSDGSTLNDWPATLGAHTVTATPYIASNAGGVSGTPLTVDFTVIDSTPVVTAPVSDPSINVSITNPTNGESQAAPGYYVIRTATSDSAGALGKVAFYVNGNLLGTADTQPFDMAWENAAPGSYVLTAVASDGSGSTTSAPVNVTITPATTVQTIYVSPTGSDSNNGLSLGAPLQTISAAANIAQPGDTVLIEPGTYPETVVVPTSGTATQPITFQAAVPGTVFIDGADPLGGWTANSGTNPVFTTAWNHDFFHDGSRYYFGLSTDGTTTTVGYAEQFLYNNKPLTQVLSLSNLAAGDFYVDYTARTVSVWLPGGATPSSSNILASTRNHLFVPASTSVEYIRVDGLTFQHASNFAQDGAVQTATGWRIINSTIQGVNSTAVEVRGNDDLMYNDHALNNGDTGFNGDGTNDLFLFDETAGNNYKGYSVYNEAGGGKFTQSDGLYFDQYFAHNNVGPGLWFDYENTNYTVVNSFFYDNQPRVANYEGIGLQVEISQGPGRIENDTFYGNTGAAVDICESMNVTVMNNSFDNSYVEMRDLAGRAPYHIQNIQISNNEFDNSFICTSLGVWTTTSAATKQIVINNDTFDNTGPLIYWNSIGYSSLSSIQDTLGLESNGKLGILSFIPAPIVL